MPPRQDERRPRRSVCSCRPAAPRSARQLHARLSHHVGAHPSAAARPRRRASRGGTRPKRHQERGGPCPGRGGPERARAARRTGGSRIWPRHARRRSGSARQAAVSGRMAVAVAAAAAAAVAVAVAVAAEQFQVVGLPAAARSELAEAHATMRRQRSSGWTAAACCAVILPVMPHAQLFAWQEKRPPSRAHNRTSERRRGRRAVRTLRSSGCRRDCWRSLCPSYTAMRARARALAVPW